MFLCNTDKGRFWWRKRDILEYLAVQTTRQELHANLVSFDFRGAANGHWRTELVRNNDQTYWDLLFLSFFSFFSPQKVDHREVCVLLRLLEWWLEAVAVERHTTSDEF